MSGSKQYRLIATGDFTTIGEAQNALQLPFIEDFVEETGRFRNGDLQNIRVASGISLGDLQMVKTAPETFEITCFNSALRLNKRRVDELAETLRCYLIFDEIMIEEIK